jgi:hypothetical protein
MAEKILVVPAAGLLVRDPANMLPLPPEGAEVEQSSHWQRRLNAGDVTLGKAAKHKKGDDK